jgi:acetate---CoA ligase (ADP-forming)
VTEKQYNNVLVEREGGITFAALNRPDQRNAMSPELHYEMEDGPTAVFGRTNCPNHPMRTAHRKDIEGLLNPRNVALVGASDRNGHWSRRVWNNLRRFRFDGGVFPVNPNRADIWGGPCFASVDAMPEPPDHLAIFTPAEAALEVLRRGASAGARSATIYAAGFGEGGSPDRDGLARELRSVLNDSGMTAVGPNCMGVGSGKSRFTTIPDETLQEFAPSPIAVVSQSGAMSTSMNRAVNALGHKVALLVSCGNQIGCTVQRCR